MKKFATSLSFFLLIVNQLAFGQCPPAGFPNPGYTCQTAPVLCPTLDGYCVNTALAPPVVPPVPIPGCAGGFVFNNPIWFGFFAGTQTITMQITANNCVGGNNGIQAGIYDNCISTAMDLQCSCSSNFTLSDNGFVPGEVYWFFIDGCSGADCDISIDVTAGSTAGLPPSDPGMINGPMTVCAGTTSSYNIPVVPLATIYDWSLTPSLGTLTENNQNATVTWGSEGGEVELCVDVANACYANDNPSCKTITIIERPTATISGSGVICGGQQPDVQLEIAFTGEGPWTFVIRRNGVPLPPITTTDNPYIFMPTQAGTYTLQSVSTPPGNCTGTVSGSSVVTVNNLSANIQVTAQATCGQSNGNINLTVSGGNPPYEFEWSNGDDTEDLMGVPGGTYAVTVTDEDGCTVTRSVDVQNQQTNVNVTGTVQPSTVCVGGNGSITTNVTPGGNTYTYEWSNGATTPNLNMLEPGTYTVTVTLAGDCTDVQDFEVPAAPNAPNVSLNDVESTCELPNGSITSSVSGGVQPYTYEWSNGATTPNLTGVLAGTYSLTVTGANGCTAEAEATVGNNNPPINISGSTTDNTTCNPPGNGSINVSVSPNGTYTYLWSNGAVTQDLINQPPGSYTITVTGQGACTAEETFEIEDDPNEPSVNLNTNGTTCELPNGNITSSVSGGTTPYSYSWSTGATTPNINGVPAGTYSLTVTGANGCTAEDEITVDNDNPDININGNANDNTTCNPPGNGSISISVSPAGSYTYLWSNGAVTQNINNQPPGTYSVTVTGQGACTGEAEFTIEDDPIVPELDLNANESICELPNGSITSSVSGGVPNYTYSWSNGATTPNLNGIPAGPYSLTVTAANGCTAEADVNVGNDNPPIDIDADIENNSNCNGGGNGSITVSVSPAGNYTYNWSTGATSLNLTGLTSGTYSITVTGQGACSAEADFTVDNDPNLPQLDLDFEPSTCDLPNGSITSDVSNGQPNFTYSWSNGATTPNLNNVPPGPYSLTVTDAAGCMVEADINLENENPDIEIDAEVEPNTKCVGQNGFIQITDVDPPGSYTYLWSNGSTSTTLTNLPPGTYTVTVNGGGSCTAEAEFTVEDEPELPEVELEAEDATCDLPNGSIQSDVFGGQPNYTYLWSNGATVPNLNNIAPGNYSLVVTDALGCTGEADIFVGNDNPFIDVEAEIENNTKCIGGNGSIEITDIDPPATYTYLWSTGATTTIIRNLPAGTYTVTVNGGGSCTTEVDFTVEDVPDAPLIFEDVTNAECGLNNGSVQLDVDGAQPPYTFLWSNGAVTQNLNNVPGDFYTVTVTSINGCSEVAFIDVPDDAIPIFLFADITNNTSCRTAKNGEILLDLDPDNMTVTWENGSHSSYLTGLEPGDYAVTVSAGGTCTDSGIFTVEDEAEIPDLSANTSDATCGENNGEIDLDVFSGEEPYTFHWSNNADDEDLYDMPPGDYDVTVTTAAGCSATTSASIFDNQVPISVSGVPTPRTSCLVPNGSIALSVMPAGNPYTFEWGHGPTTQNLQNLPVGTYTVTVSLGQTCTATANFAITDQAIAPNLSASGSPANCDLPNGSATATATGGVSPYQFAWQGGGSTATVTGLLPGTYNVTATGANGCSTTASALVANNNTPLNISGLITKNTSCATGNGGINISVDPPGPYTYNWSNMASTEDVNGLGQGGYSVTVSAGGTCSSTAYFVVEDNTSDPVITPDVTAAICSNPDGSINLSVSGPGAPFSFLWESGETTQNLANLFPGNYTVTVTGTNGCTATQFVNVANNSTDFTIAGVAAPQTNCQIKNGEIDLTITPPGTYDVSWSNGDGMQDLTGLEPGIYTVTVTKTGSCVATASFNVGLDISYPNVQQTVSPEICGLQNGSIELAVAGGVTPYSFKWESGQTTQDLLQLPAGNYTVTISGANGCTTTTSANVPANSIAFALSGQTQPNASCVQNNGSVDLNITPAGTYIIEWSNGSGNEDLNGLPGGPYNVTVSAGGNCTNTANFTVGDQTDSPLVAGSIEAALCGASNGSIDLSPSGGQSPYSFIWTDGYVTEDLQNINSGDFSVTVTGANGCAAVNSFTVPENTFSPNISGQTAANTACVGPNGHIDLTVGPAGNNYSFAWSSGQSTQNLSNLLGGSYEVTVSAGGACTAVATFNLDDEPDAPAVSPDITPALCSQQNGDIDVTVTGGPQPYQYQWTNTAGQQFSTNEDLQNIFSGNYSLTVTAANGCTAEATCLVSNNSNNFQIAGATTANTFCVGGNGAINLEINPPGAYTFDWQGGQSSEDITDLPPGNYTVTVTDATLCAVSKTFTVPDDAIGLTLTGAATDARCFGNNEGSIAVTVFDGLAPFDFNWSPAIPGDPQNPDNLYAGDYTVTATDAKGCTGTANFDIKQPASAVQVACSAVATVSQPGLTDGKATANISGGISPYIVTWTPGSTAADVPPGIFSMENLGVGAYGLTVTDANGCPADCNFNINLADCETSVGQMGGSPVEHCGSGCATANYNSIGQFLDPNDVLQFVLYTGQSGQIGTILARNSSPEFCFVPGQMFFDSTYFVSAIAGNNDGSGNVNLNDFCAVISNGQPLVFRQRPIASATQPDPITCAVTTVILTGSTDLPNPAFGWSTLGGQIIGPAAQAQITAGKAGLYTLIVYANGCSDTTAVDVLDIRNTPEANITASPDDILDCKISQITLAGEIKGTQNANSIWLDALTGNVYGLGSTLTIDAPGTFQFIILDTLTRCADTAAIVINENLQYPALFVQPPGKLSCTNPSVTLNGSTPFPGIVFTWATINGSDTTIVGTGLTLTVTQPGIYHFIGVDPANNCSNILATTVEADLSLPVASAGQPFNMDCYGERKLLDGSASTGLPGMSFRWTTTDGLITAGATTSKPEIGEPGIYFLLVTNPNGCTDTEEVLVSPNPPRAQVELEQPLCFGEKGVIRVENIEGAKPPVRFSIDGGQTFTGSPIFQNLQPGDYTILLTDADTCSTSLAATILEGLIFEISLEPQAIIELGDSYLIEATTNAPLSTLEYIRWKPSDGLSCDTCLTTLADSVFRATRYELTVRTNDGCEDRAPFLLLVDREINVYVPNIFSPDGDGVNDEFTIFADTKAVKNIESFYVFDRWGEKVYEYFNFQPNNPALGWKGDFLGKPLNPAVFVWYATLELVDGRKVFFEGDVTLKR